MTNKTNNLYTVTVDGETLYDRATLHDVMMAQAVFRGSQILAALIDNAADVAADVAADNAADVIPHIETRIDILARDKRQLWRKSADYLADVYGLEKTAQKCDVAHVMTVRGEYVNADKAERLVYRHIASGQAYAQIDGALYAVPESCVRPEVAPVRVSHVAPKNDGTPRKSPRKSRKGTRRKFSHVAFEDNGRCVVRKLYSNGTVQHNGARIDAKTLCNVTRHYSKDAAEKRRASFKRAAKANAKATARANKTAQKTYIPDEYRGVTIDKSRADMRKCDTEKAWANVRDYVDELISAGVVLDHVAYSRTWAWCEPVDKSEKYARKMHNAVPMSGGTDGTCKRGHSLKATRRAWFIECAK